MIFTGDLPDSKKGNRKTTNPPLNKWWDSDWYKEWEKLARDRCSQNQKPEGFWRYDNMTGEFIYEKM